MAICGELENMSIPDIRKLVDLNFLGTLYAIRAIILKMKARREGIIVITSSQCGLFGIYGYSVYAGTKFALRGLAESLEMEVRPFNISVTLALPPDTDTPGLENENKSKPLITQLISESAGLYSPVDVAKSILKHSLVNKVLFLCRIELHYEVVPRIFGN